MKVKYLKLKNWLLVTVMGALGLSACHCGKKVAEPKEEETPAVRPREEMRLMYGVPTMDFHIRGQVRDSAGKPVKNIRVNLLERGLEATADTIYGDQENIRKYLESNEVRTDKEGRFELRASDLPQEQVRILVRDADGKSSGHFSNQLLDVKADHVDRSQAQGMYQGTFNANLEVNLENK